MKYAVDYSPYVVEYSPVDTDSYDEWIRQTERLSEAAISKIDNTNPASVGIVLLSVFIISAFILHVSLRKLYGRQSLVWAYVEYAWTGLSLVALLLATVQLSARFIEINRSNEIREIIDLWNNNDRLYDAMIRHHTKNTFFFDFELGEFGLGYHIDVSPLELGGHTIELQFDINEDVLESVTRLDLRCRQAFVPHGFKPTEIPSETQMLNDANDLIAKLKKRYVSTYSDVFFGRNSTEDAQVDSILVYCMNVDAIKSRLSGVIKSDDRSVPVEIMQFASFWWSYILCFGLALKFIKATSDLRGATTKKTPNSGPSGGIGGSFL